MISSDALGPDGREVRCGKCGHMWFQPPERDSLDDLPSIPEPAHEDFDIGFKSNDEPAPEPVKPPPVQTVVPEKEYKLDKIISRNRQKQVAGVMVALATVMVLFYGFVAMNNTLGRAVPFLGAAYEKMGFHLKREKPQIAFDRLKLTKQGVDITVSGMIINLTSEDVSVHNVKLELTDFDYKPLKETDIKLEGNKLKAESSEKIEYVFKDAPKDAVSVRVKVTP